MWGGGVGDSEGITTRVESHSLMSAPSASLLTSFFSPQKVLPASTSAPGWSMSLSAPNWMSSSGMSPPSWCPPPSSIGPSSSIPEEFLSPPPQIFGSQLYGGGTSQQSDVNILSEHHRSWTIWCWNGVQLEGGNNRGSWHQTSHSETSISKWPIWKYKRHQKVIPNCNITKYE